MDVEDNDDDKNILHTSNALSASSEATGDHLFGLPPNPTVADARSLAQKRMCPIAACTKESGLTWQAHRSMNRLARVLRCHLGAGGTCVSRRFAVEGIPYLTSRP
jgi:hypothetical protein